MSITRGGRVGIKGQMKISRGREDQKEGHGPHLFVGECSSVLEGRVVDRNSERYCRWWMLWGDVRNGRVGVERVVFVLPQSSVENKFLHR